MGYLVGIFYTVLLVAVLFFGPALGAIAIRRSLSIRWQLVLLGVCIFYEISPFLLALAGVGLAERFGCQVETITYRCPGTPWLGDVIMLMTFAHWGAFFTIPSGVLGLIGLLASLAGLRQISSPNKAQSCDVREEYVPILIQPLYKAKINRCPKRL